MVILYDFRLDDFSMMIHGGHMLLWFATGFYQVCEHRGLESGLAEPETVETLRAPGGGPVFFFLVFLFFFRKIFHFCFSFFIFFIFLLQLCCS